MNPYRIGSTYASVEDVASAYSDYPNNPASKKENVLMGSTLQILNPGIPEVRDFIVDTCMEVVNNYDVDAIHFDDYFTQAVLMTQALSQNIIQKDYQHQILEENK